MFGEKNIITIKYKNVLNYKALPENFFSQKKDIKLHVHVLDMQIWIVNESNYAEIVIKENWSDGGHHELCQQRLNS